MCVARSVGSGLLVPPAQESRRSWSVAARNVWVTVACTHKDITRTGQGLALEKC